MASRSFLDFKRSCPSFPSEAEGYFFLQNCELVAVSDEARYSLINSSTNSLTLTPLACAANFSRLRNW